MDLNYFQLPSHSVPTIASQISLFFSFQAAKHPNQDLSGAEVEAACRFCEHLLYLGQLGREALGDTAAQLPRLNRLVTLLEGFTIDGDLPQQRSNSLHCFEVQEKLAGLLSHTAEEEALLRAAAQLESAPGPHQELQQAADALSAVHARLQQGLTQLGSLTATSFTFANGQLFVTTELHAAVQEAHAVLKLLASEVDDSPHASQPGWGALAAAFSKAAEQSDIEISQEELSAEALLHEVAAKVEALVETGLVWAQGLKEKELSGAKAEDDEDPGEAVPLPSAVQAATRRLGLPRLMQVLDHGTAALKLLAQVADTGDAAATTRAASLLASVGPMLSMLRAGLWQLVARSLSLHRSVTKLTYVTSALFAGVVEEGFCIPDGEEGEPQEGEEKITQGTGLGDGDTQGAKDISDELQDEDQLLGAQQKGQQEQKQEESAPEPEGPDAPKGVEMEEDFEGALEDVQPNAAEEDGESLWRNVGVSVHAELNDPHCARASFKHHVVNVLLTFRHVEYCR